MFVFLIVNGLMLCDIDRETWGRRKVECTDGKDRDFGKSCRTARYNVRLGDMLALEGSSDASRITVSLLMLG